MNTFKRVTSGFGTKEGKRCQEPFSGGSGGWLARPLEKVPDTFSTSHLFHPPYSNIYVTIPPSPGSASPGISIHPAARCFVVLPLRPTLTPAPLPSGEGRLKIPFPRLRGKGMGWGMVSFVVQLLILSTFICVYPRLNFAVHLDISNLCLSVFICG